VGGIPTEVPKTGSPALEIRVHNLIKAIWRKEIVLKYWIISMICPIYKKEEKTECSN
jgi:hypothetical protein